MTKSVVVGSPRSYIHAGRDTSRSNVDDYPPSTLFGRGRRRRGRRRSSNGHNFLGECYDRNVRGRDYSSYNILGGGRDTATKAAIGGDLSSELANADMPRHSLASMLVR